MLIFLPLWSIMQVR